MITSREIIFNSFRNIGFKDDKPADEKLILNHSIKQGETGDLVILIGPNNSGKSNILDGIQWSKYINGMNCQREIERCQREIEGYQRKIEDYQREIEDYQREIEDYQREIEDYQWEIEYYQWRIEDCQREIEDCQRVIEDCQRVIECRPRAIEFTTNLYSDEACREPDVSFHFTNAYLNKIKLADIKNENIRQLIEDKVLENKVLENKVFSKLLKEEYLSLYKTWCKEYNLVCEEYIRNIVVY